jgi:hypothetical protein
MTRRAGARIVACEPGSIHEHVRTPRRGTFFEHTSARGPSENLHLTFDSSAVGSKRGAAPAFITHISSDVLTGTSKPSIVRSRTFGASDLGSIYGDGRFERGRQKSE